ncbi:hypothetical protein HK405_004320, partial [Cladochytrium tenue]
MLNASGSSGAVRASTFPSAMPTTTKTTAPVPVRRIGPAFDEHEAQLSSSRSARRKVVFKIVMPSREVVLVANNPTEFREFRRFVEENRVRILSGGSDESKGGGGGGGGGDGGDVDDDDSSIAEDESFSAAHTDGRSILRNLMDADESNSGVYRGHANYIVRSFLFDVSLFQDHDSDAYQAVVSLVNSQSEAAILRAAELGDIPPPPLLLLHLNGGVQEAARSPTALSIDSADRPGSGLPPPPQQQQQPSAIATATVGATAPPPPQHALGSGRFRRHRSHQVSRGGGSGSARGLFGLLTPSGSSHSIDTHAAPANPPPAAAVAVAGAGGAGEGAAGSGGTGSGLHFAIARLGISLRRDASHQTSSSLSSAASSSAVTIASSTSTSASAALLSTADAGAAAATATSANDSAAPASPASSLSFPPPNYARSDPGTATFDPADPPPPPLQPISTALRARAASAAESAAAAAAAAAAPTPKPEEADPPLLSPAQPPHQPTNRKSLSLPTLRGSSDAAPVATVGSPRRFPKPLPQPPPPHDPRQHHAERAAAAAAPSPRLAASLEAGSRAVLGFLGRRHVPPPPPDQPGQPALVPPASSAAASHASVAAPATTPGMPL